MMKPGQRRKLIAAIRRRVPRLTDHGRLAIEEPRNRILRGVYLEDSSDSARCYAWVFVQALFEPAPLTISFNKGRRLGGPSRTWSVGDGATLADIVLKEGPAFWDAASNPAQLATWPSLVEDQDPYAIRTRALALIACRRWAEAADELGRLGRQLSSGTGWMGEMREWSESLRRVVGEEPEVAFNQLLRWEEENVRQLHLAPEAVPHSLKSD